MKLSMKPVWCSRLPLVWSLWSMLIGALQMRKASPHKQMIKMMKFRFVIAPPPPSILSWLDVSSQALGRALSWSSCGPRGFKCDLMFHSVSALLCLGSLSFWSRLFSVASTTAVGQGTSVSHSSNLLASVLGCCVLPAKFFQRRSAEHFDALPLGRVVASAPGSAQHAIVFGTFYGLDQLSE